MANHTERDYNAELEKVAQLEKEMGSVLYVGTMGK